MNLFLSITMLLTFFNCETTQPIAREGWGKQADNMIKEQIEKRGITDKRVLEAMRNTPRHEFIPYEYIEKAYNDSPLPIGYGQTISQPYIVALMSELLQLQGDEKVLEIGTGSGYQTAILSKLASKVYSVEIVHNLVDNSTSILQKLNHSNIVVRQGDGYEGWKEEAPFDAVIVTASPASIPEKLIEQLKPGGRMVLPVGKYYQTLKLVIKNKDGRISEETITSVRFVPMVYPQEK